MFSDIFKEANGQLSTTRVVFFGTTFIVFSVWGFCSVYGLLVPVVATAGAAAVAFKLLDLPWNVVTLVAALGGVKLFQKGQEEKPAENTPETPVQ